jgi:hypothetical protein
MPASRYRGGGAPLAGSLNSKTVRAAAIAPSGHWATSVNERHILQKMGLFRAAGISIADVGPQKKSHTAVRHVNPLPLTGRSPPICPASTMRTRVGQRTASPSLFRSRPFGSVNRKMFSFRSNPALFMA